MTEKTQIMQIFDYGIYLFEQGVLKFTMAQLSLFFKWHKKQYISFYQMNQSL